MCTMPKPDQIFLERAKGLVGQLARVKPNHWAEGTIFKQAKHTKVQPPFYIPVTCGFTKHVSGTGGRIRRA